LKDPAAREGFAEMTYGPIQSKPRDALLDLIYSAIADPSRWPEILTRVADYLGAIGGMVMHIPAAGRGHTTGIYGRLSAEHGAIVQDRYAWNLWSEAMLDVPFERAVIVSSLVDKKELFKTGFYAEVLQPQGIVDTMSVKNVVLTQDGSVGGFGFCLSVRGANRAHHNIHRMQRLVPHLTRALEGALQLGRLADGTRQLASVLQLMPNPAILINGRGRIVLTNAAAEILLRTSDGLSVDRDSGLHLTAILPTETAALSKALAQALAVAAGTGDALSEPQRLTRPSGAPPLLVLPVPLPPPTFELWNVLEPARVLVLVIDPAAQWRGKASIIRTAFGLTQAECRVAILVASGLSGPQAAKALGVSASTVKMHLKRCFNKIGVHSQVALARLFATLPIDSSGGLY
jgi:DNA-binding CsgD family transcriptional regulator